MRVEHSIDIEAPPEVVWSVTADIEGWPEWTPTVKSVSCVSAAPFGLGSIARIKQPAQPEAEWVVTDFENGRRFVWESRRRGLHFVGTHEISQNSKGAKNLLRAEAKGILAFLLWPVLTLTLQRALSVENQGLKKKPSKLLALKMPNILLVTYACRRGSACRQAK